MITILHGENTIASRKELQRIREEFKGEVISLDGKNLTETDFIQATQSNSMFSSSKLVIVEGLVKFDLKNTNCDLVFWEDKKITPPAGITSQEFKIPQTIWKFLDNMTIPLFRAALKDNDVQFVFLMIVRNFRLKSDTEKLKQLLEIDFKYKQGLLACDLPTTLELFLLNL